MMLMSMGWEDRTDGKCLADLGPLRLVIRACLEQAINVGKIVLGGFVVAPSVMYIVQGVQLLE